MVEIAKALSFNASVLIMDEPTAALTDTEIDELFRIIRDLRREGVGVVHISHRLEELKQISDRVTVMRDGRYMATIETAEAPIPTIISMMVGRTIYEEAPEIPEQPPTRSCSRSAACNRGRMVRDVIVRARTGARSSASPASSAPAGPRSPGRSSAPTEPIRGEILRPRQAGRASRSPADAVRHGIGYLSEDRKRFGLALGMDVETNIVPRVVPAVSCAGSADQHGA